MNTPPKAGRRILTPAETESLQQRVADHEEDISTPSNRNMYNPDRVNDPIERQGNERIKRVLKNGQPDSLNKHQRATLEGNVKRDIEWLQKSMVPKSHVNLRPGPQEPGFRKAVNEMATKENSPEFQTVAQRAKNGLRQLGRDSNLELYRPDSR